jgi:hypothetical protein
MVGPIVVGPAVVKGMDPVPLEVSAEPRLVLGVSNTAGRSKKELHYVARE